MMTQDQPRNQLLAALPFRDWDILKGHFQQATLPLGQVLLREGEAFNKIYFPTSGVISTVAIFESGMAAEMATTGREGMVGVGAILDSDTSLSHQVVQIAGSALIIPAGRLRHFQTQMPGFRKTLSAYAQAFLVQVMQSVACNGVHSVEERLARWLLMCHDRAGTDRFNLTQEFLAVLIGVSRPTINLAARTLQRAGLIEYRRGLITISDREGLEASSCECYGIIRSQYEARLSRVLRQNGHD
jgi:CRP-like cAMP-binding protein